MFIVIVILLFDMQWCLWDPETTGKNFVLKFVNLILIINFLKYINTARAELIFWLDRVSLSWNSCETAVKIKFNKNLN